MAVPAARAEFTAAFTLSGNVADPNSVLPGTTLIITLTDTQGYGTNWYDDDITRIQLNWANSPAGLNLGAATWTWGSALSGLGTFINDCDMSDSIVNRQNEGLGVAPASPFVVGTLTFVVPAYQDGGTNTYVLDLAGGDYDEETLSVVGDGETYLLASPHGTGLTLSGYQFSVLRGGVWTAAVSNEWGTGADWSGGAAPDPAFVAVFDGAVTSPDGASARPTLFKDESVKQVKFLTGRWAVSPDAGSNFSLTIGNGGITSAGADTNTINAPVLLGDHQTWTVADGNTLRINNTITGAYTLTKDGGGALVAGDTTLNALDLAGGTISLASLTGSGTTPTATIGDEMTLTVTGSISGLDLLTVLGILNAGGTVNAVTTTIGAAGGTPLVGALSADGGSTGTLNLVNGTADYGTGGLTVTGTVTVGSASHGGTLMAGVATANTFHGINGTATLSSLAGTGSSPSVLVESSHALTVSQAIRDMSQVTVEGTIVTGTANNLTKALAFGGTPDAPSGQWDLTDGNLIIDYEAGSTPMADVVKYVKAGRNAGSGYWDGQGLMSTDAHNSTLTALGVIDNNGLDSVKDTLEGEAVDHDAILIKYTYLGDNNLDGKVDWENDFLAFQNGVLFGIKNNNNWLYGDYNYDGVVDWENDFLAFQNGILFQGGPLGGVGQSSELGSVPEPATLALVILGAAALGGRRRPPGRGGQRAA
jgi:hypothetical protein